MKYWIELAASAKADIRAAAQWLRERASEAVVDKWLSGLSKAINTLQTQPQRCPIIDESHKFSEELRELLHGRKKSGKYRIIFTIEHDVV